ncbi:MAG: hypothetical protein ACE5GB_00520 [Acidimicrobiales bacterium]
MPTQLIGRPLLDLSGLRIGTITAVVNGGDQPGPDLLVVRTRWYGREWFVPRVVVSRRRRSVVTPFNRADVESGLLVSRDRRPPEPADVEDLFRHYGLPRSAAGERLPA